jgi:hypothetical protein
MSASDAAPLPRLGEVFFDVRGSSRSMRLSWYADTGIAVFSIWQGGMCTGTFRLPIGDLPRMIEILQRGPDDQEPLPPRRQGRRSGQRPGERESGHSGRREFRTGAMLHPERDQHGYPGASEARYGYEDEEEGPGYDRDDSPRRARGGHGREESAVTRGSRHAGGHAGDEAGEESWSGYGGDGEADRAWSEYGRAGYPPEQAGRGYEQDEFPGSSHAGYGQAYEQSESAGHRWDEEDDAVTGGHEAERFVPPYVGSGPGEYGNDIPARSTDVLGEPRGAAYQENLPRSRSQSADYDREPWPEDGYSDGPGYRLPDRPAGSGDAGPGRHSAG